jgi:hypothetical protein
VNRAVENPTSAIKTLPHWRVTLRPDRHEPELVPTLGELWAIVGRTKLSLRGWDYPHIDFAENQEQGSNWVASWSDFQGHKEYWRFYQSGQFVHLFTVREVTEPGWQDKLRNSARVFIGPQAREGSPTFISIGSFLWTVTEIFEFAARLAEVGVYREMVNVSIRLEGIANFALTETDRHIHNLYRNTIDVLEKTWEIGSTDLLAKSSEHALSATVWFFERFGWLRPPLDSLRDEQEKLLKGLF